MFCFVLDLLQSSDFQNRKNAIDTFNTVQIMISQMSLSVKSRSEAIQLHLHTICITIRWSRSGYFRFDTRANTSFISVCSAEEFGGTESEM